MESLTQKLHPGVVLNFQRVGGAGAMGVQDSIVPMEVESKYEVIYLSTTYLLWPGSGLCKMLKCVVFDKTWRISSSLRTCMLL